MPTDPKTGNNKSRTNQKEQKRQMKAEEKPSKKAKTKEKKPKKGRRRILPIWLRIIIVLLLSAVALIVGVMVGYGILGDGDPMDALQWDTWQHILDIVTQTE
ncbi:DNA-directed RNA polymerase subunit beta [Halobacillus fulvus]|nr:DNA-directed RNA polymerase subunit beta [Halobacillus fulvus]